MHVHSLTILDADYCLPHQPAQYRQRGVRFRFEADDRRAVERQIWAALWGPPLHIQAEREADGTWWVRHGVDLSGVFENWPRVGQAVMELGEG